AHMQHALLRAVELAPQRFPGAKPPKPQPRPVTATVEADPNRDGRYVVELTIAPGYHLHANPSGDPALSPTTLTPGDVTYPPGERKRYAYGDTEVSVYEGTVRLPVQLDPDALPTELIVTCQPCTDRVCEQPMRLAIPLNE